MNFASIRDLNIHNKLHNERSPPSQASPQLEKLSLGSDFRPNSENQKIYSNNGVNLEKSYNSQNSRGYLGHKNNSHLKKVLSTKNSMIHLEKFTTNKLGPSS